jgi:protein-tyrosine kinase
MSRIDEALARARTMKPEDLLPVPVPIGPDMAFPLEAEEVEDSLRDDARQEVALSDLAPEPETTPDVVDVDAELSAAPVDEKLMLHTGDGTSVEEYRRLAARLLMAQAEHQTRVVMIASALPGEGNTITSTNLALILSESYKRRVLLVDADLRRPWIHKLFQLPNVSGLNEGLRSGEERKVPLIQVSENLSVLTAGRPEPDPMSVLSGERMRKVLEEAGARFEWVIIDTPPVALLPDAHVLSSLVDAVILIVQSGKTPLPAIKTAVNTLGQERILGVVLNRVDDRPTSGYRYYAYNDSGVV